MRFRACLLAITSIAAFAVPALAQNDDVPYWASLKADEVYMRVGPSADYKIDWVYHRAQLPVKVIRLREAWALVEDVDGTKGWISRRMLGDNRTVIVIGDGPAAMRDLPAENSSLKWNAEPGVVGKLGECEKNWCELDVGGRKGWVRDVRLWGEGEP